MKKFSLFLLLILILGCNSHKILNNSSLEEVNYIPYYLKIYEADSLAMVGMYEESFQKFDSLFTKFKPLNTFFYNEYESYIKVSYLSNHLKKMDKKVRILISEFGYPIEWFISDSTKVLYKVYSHSNIDLLEYNKLRSLYLNSIDFELRHKIVEMKYKDQYYRKLYDGIDIVEKRKETDSINESILKGLFKQNIYPNEAVIGNSSIDENLNLDLSTLLLHTDLEIRTNYLFENVLYFVKQGKCSPNNYALMIDQKESYINKKTIYGTYRFSKIDTNDYYIYNKNRSNIGLPSIEYELWRPSKISEFSSL